MKCEDCGFEYGEGETCPRCGYDPKVDLLQCVSVENPQVENKLETEFNNLCIKVRNEENGQSKMQAAWKEIDKKAKQGDFEARHMMSHLALSRKQFDPGHKILAHLADAGYALAQVDLAKFYEDGLGGVEKNPYDAIRLYRLAATKGNPIALFKLARHHSPGGLLSTDVELANAIMEKMVPLYPNMFVRRQPPAGSGQGPNADPAAASEDCSAAGPSCSCMSKGPTAQEFAAKSASDMGKMIKYLILFGIVAFAIYVIWTEFFAK